MEDFRVGASPEQNMNGGARKRGSVNRVETAVENSTVEQEAVTRYIVDVVGVAKAADAAEMAGATEELPEASTWGHDGVWPLPMSLPMIIGDEVAELSARFGRPEQRTFHVQADDYIYSYRFNKSADRRAEVVFAIEDASGQFWVHTKNSYPQHIFRLPTGGVHCDELVMEGLLREVNEETGLPVEIVRFLGIIEYEFSYGGRVAPFASYVFHLHSACVCGPCAQPGEPISEFRAVSAPQLRQLALNLRGLAGARRAWGEWRALAHDFVCDTLMS